MLPDCTNRPRARSLDPQRRLVAVNRSAVCLGRHRGGRAAFQHFDLQNCGTNFPSVSTGISQSRRRRLISILASLVRPLGKPWAAAPCQPLFQSWDSTGWGGGMGLEAGRAVVGPAKLPDGAGEIFTVPSGVL